MKRLVCTMLLAAIVAFAFTIPTAAALTLNPDHTVTDDDRGDGNGLMWLEYPVYMTVPMTWDEAMTWAENLEYAGYNDWRLPSALQFGTSFPDYDLYSEANEWGHLYGFEWGNPPAPSPPMADYCEGWYWTSTEDGFEAFAFYISYDFAFVNQAHPKDVLMFVTAVRDLAPAPPPEPPVASFTVTPDTAPVGTEITFDPSGSYDLDGTIVSWYWGWGTGAAAAGGGFPPVMTIPYWAGGSYTVTLKVTDNDGLTDTASAEITITPVVILPATIWSCDADGNPKDEFLPGEEVYVDGSGFEPYLCISFKVVLNGAEYTAANNLAPPGAATSTTDTGDLWDVCWLGIYPGGEYDIWADINGNGEWDDGEPVDTFGSDYGFFVVPEYPLGTIMGIAMCFAALAVFKSKSLRIHL